VKEVIEQQIRELLKLDEIRATTLSNILFSQFGGLFGQLASTEAERRIVGRSSLFQEALARVHELERRDSAGLGREVDFVNAALARGKAQVIATRAVDGVQAQASEGFPTGDGQPPTKGVNESDAP
jgi:hypothetical protein